MFFLERLQDETPDELRVWLEDLLYELYPDTVRHIATLLDRKPFSCWPGIIRTGNEARYGGKAFCFIDWFALRTFSILRRAVADREIWRDVLVVTLVRKGEDGSSKIRGVIGPGYEHWLRPNPDSPDRPIVELYRGGFVSEIEIESVYLPAKLSPYEN